MSVELGFFEGLRAYRLGFSLWPGANPEDGEFLFLLAFLTHSVSPSLTCTLIGRGLGLFMERTLLLCFTGR